MFNTTEYQKRLDQVIELVSNPGIKELLAPLAETKDVYKKRRKISNIGFNSGFKEDDKEVYVKVGKMNIRGEVIFNEPINRTLKSSSIYAYGANWYLKEDNGYKTVDITNYDDINEIGFFFKPIGMIIPVLGYVTNNKTGRLGDCKSFDIVYYDQYLIED